MSEFVVDYNVKIDKNEVSAIMELCLEDYVTRMINDYNRWLGMHGIDVPESVAQAFIKGVAKKGGGK